MIEWVFLGIVLFFSAMVIGVGGFGFNIMVIAFAPLLFPVKFVIPLSINLSLVLNLFLLIRCYQHILPACQQGTGVKSDQTIALVGPRTPL